MGLLQTTGPESTTNFIFTSSLGENLYLGVGRLDTLSMTQLAWVNITMANHRQLLLLGI